MQKLNKFVGHITFHNSTNYGAVLQTIALQKILNKYGYRSEIIDYECQAKKNNYKELSLSLKKSLKENVGSILNYPFKVVKNNKVNKFIDENYTLTHKKYKSTSELKELDEKYDKVICGSDQIWNYENTKFDKAYFLNFIKNNNKKVSYAGSFGLSEIKQEYKEEYGKLLSSISYLSVREKQGKKMIEEIINKSVETVLDPTYLLTKDEWLDFSTGDIPEKDYILVYSVKNSPKIISIAKKLSKQINKKILVVYSSWRFVLKGKTKIPCPKEYVSLFNNADFIVTDSFHGVSFSLNLNKNFYVFLSEKHKNNSRIENILEEVKLENRIVRKDLKFKTNKKINYKYVNDILKSKREDSIEFLLAALVN